MSTNPSNSGGSSPLFLGLDLSTQKLKGTLISSDLSIVADFAVDFDRDLPQYKSTNHHHLLLLLPAHTLLTLLPLSTTVAPRPGCTAVRAVMGW